MARDGVAKVTSGGVARAGLRQHPSPTSRPRSPCSTPCSPTDHRPRREFGHSPERRSRRGRRQARRCRRRLLVANPARYHLMFQRTIPGFQPSEESHQVALESSRSAHRLAAAGVTAEPTRIALVRALTGWRRTDRERSSGHLFADQTARGIRALVSRPDADPAVTGRASAPDLLALHAVRLLGMATLSAPHVVSVSTRWPCRAAARFPKPSAGCSTPSSRVPADGR
jgi:hypothetical protein